MHLKKILQTPFQLVKTARHDQDYPTVTKKKTHVIFCVVSFSRTVHTKRIANRVLNSFLWFISPYEIGP